MNLYCKIIGIIAFVGSIVLTLIAETAAHEIAAGLNFLAAGALVGISPKTQR